MDSIIENGIYRAITGTTLLNNYFDGKAIELIVYATGNYICQELYLITITESRKAFRVKTTSGFSPWEEYITPSNSYTKIFESTTGKLISNWITLDDSISNYDFIDIRLNTNSTTDSSDTRSFITIPRSNIQTFSPIWIGGGKSTATCTYIRFMYNEDYTQMCVNGCGYSSNLYVYRIYGYK